LLAGVIEHTGGKRMNLVDTLTQSFNDAMGSLVAAIPTLVGALIILLVGWAIGRIVGGIVTSLLTRANADQWFGKYAGEVYGTSTEAMAPTRLLGGLARWFIYLVFFIAAANYLGWPQVSSLLNDFIAWLPNLVAAIVIIIAAPVVGHVLRLTVEGASQGLGTGSARLLGQLVQIGVIVFGVMAALYQVGIASDLINTLFVGIVAATALALGLAFGLGGRDVAADITRAAYNATQSSSAPGGAPRPASTPPPPAGGPGGESS
jgi:small-conductance mechanosensitive channel